MHACVQSGHWLETSLAGKELHDLVKSKHHRGGGREAQPHTGLHQQGYSQWVVRRDSSPLSCAWRTSVVVCVHILLEWTEQKTVSVLKGLGHEVCEKRVGELMLLRELLRGASSCYLSIPNERLLRRARRVRSAWEHGNRWQSQAGTWEILTRHWEKTYKGSSQTFKQHDQQDCRISVLEVVQNSTNSWATCSYWICFEQDVGTRSHPAVSTCMFTESLV